MRVVAQPFTWNDSPSMASNIRINQQLEGRVRNYIVSAQLAKDIWAATTPPQNRKVIIKTAPKSRLDNKRAILKHFQGRPYIRQLLDEIEQPPSLVLQYLEDNLLQASSTKTLERSEIKFVAKRVLQALQALHEDGYTHTDIKPDNILVDYGDGPSRFADVQLADCGDVCRIDSEEYLKVGVDGSHIGAAIFRSPEAMLQLRWGPSTDIWSFGTTLISLIRGLDWHMFKPSPQDATFDDEEFLIHILIRQLAHFGPVPKSYIDLIPRQDSDRWVLLATAIQFIKDNDRQRPFQYIQDECLTEEDREFLLKTMKFDPRERPSARDLLLDKWFEGVE
ncbi:serine threonine protein kinase [Phlyctema vagabunda]|uniref:Serine threonine protein kinase n=1 Tax=Phlyctema vagabunda TaxID=108571 RepID=A0ABR4PAT4_9HELO